MNIDILYYSNSLLPCNVSAFEFAKMTNLLMISHANTGPIHPTYTNSTYNRPIN